MPSKTNQKTNAAVICLPVNRFALSPCMHTGALRPARHKARHRGEPKNKMEVHHTMKSFITKVNEAATMFLTPRGYEIINEPWNREDGMLPVDIVAIQDEAVVFVSTKSHNAESDPLNKNQCYKPMQT